MYGLLPHRGVLIFSVRNASPSMEISMRENGALTISSETKQKTLEEVAAAFGDKVVLADDGPKQASVAGEADHVETVGRPDP